MPPSTASAKHSPTAAVAEAVVDTDVKEFDDANTHTSESVCSSSGTDADTTTTTPSTHTSHTPSSYSTNLHHRRDNHRRSSFATLHGALSEPVNSSDHAVLTHFSRSPTSPMPCGFPEDFTTTAAAAADREAETALTPTNVSTLVETPVRVVHLPSQQGSTRKTPAPPPPIDFCRPPTSPPAPLPDVQNARNGLSAAGFNMAVAVAAAAAAGDVVGLCSPLSAAPDTASTTAATCVSPASAAMENSLGGTSLKPLAPPSTLHAYSEPFHPLEGGYFTHPANMNSNSSNHGSTGGAFATYAGSSGYNGMLGSSLAHSVGLDGGASARASAMASVSPTSTPHHSYVGASSSGGTTGERRTPPSAIPCVIGESYARPVNPTAAGDSTTASTSKGTSAGNNGALSATASGLPPLSSSFTRTAVHAGAVTTSRGGSGSTHWQDTSAAPYYYYHPHFTNNTSTNTTTTTTTMNGDGGSGPLAAEDSHGYAPFASASGPLSDSAARSQDGNSPASLMASAVRPDGPPRPPYAAWATPSLLSTGAEEPLPSYAGPRPLFFPDPPLGGTVAAASPGDFDYGESSNGYDDAAYDDQNLRFGSYVPQDIQCVEHLADLEYICHGILAEGAALQQQYRRRCRERQYLAEDTLGDEDESESKMVVALDLEGRSLGRSGSICIITLATFSAVYIIDMVLLGAQALAENSALKAVLESDTITKLMFDCRADCDALYFLYHVRLRNVCDLQISSCFALFPMARHLPGMKDVFRALGLFADEDTHIKNAGRHLFNPESGGSFDRWEERPLTDILLQYCAVDVKYFFLAKLMLWDHLEEGYCMGEARLASVCAGHFVGCSKGNSLREF